MKGTFQPISERLDSFQGKRGVVNRQILSLLDLDDSPFLNTVDYVFPEEEKIKYSGKLIGKRVSIAFTDAKTNFSGRLTLSGRILEVK